jgi:hypothetical protein
MMAEADGGVETDSRSDGRGCARRKRDTMHEVLVGCAFLMMLAVPCLVTMVGNDTEDTLSTILDRAGAGEEV